MKELLKLIGTAIQGSDSTVAADSYTEPPTSIEDDNMTDTTRNPSRWARSGSMHWGVQDSIESLACGMYEGGHANGVGYFLSKRENITDGLIHLPDSASDAVLREISEFAELKPEFEKRDLIYKRGIFLWGPPGSGKTSTIAQLVDVVITKMNGIAFMVDHPGVASECLKLIRMIEPERQIIAMMEDIDALVSRYGEAAYLSILDGENQVNNIIFVATTNYPERMDRRFIDRPSRFDSVIKVGMPTAEARAVYLKAKEPSLTKKQVEEYVRVSDGFSIAHLRELIILTRVFKRNLTWAAKKLRAMIDSDPSSAREGNGSVGFTEQRGDDNIALMPARDLEEEIAAVLKAEINTRDD